MKTKKDIKPRLTPKTSNGCSMQYVTGKDIADFHGEEWAQKWSNAFGIGTVGMVQESGKAVCAYYYHDYERFADLVDYGNPTYWD